MAASPLRVGVLLLSLARIASAPAPLDSFEGFEKRYAKQYPSIAARAQARANFDRTIAEIEEHNSKDSSWKMGLNKFADLSLDDYTSLVSVDFSSSSPPENAVPFKPAALFEELASDVDWHWHPGRVH